MYERMNERSNKLKKNIEENRTMNGKNVSFEKFEEKNWTYNEKSRKKANNSKKRERN